jgi:hypothetical protein
VGVSSEMGVCGSGCYFYDDIWNGVGFGICVVGIVLF